MFEPRAFASRSSAQDALMEALQQRDMEAFETALADPSCDPNYWYGKPYWTTCLQLATKTEGCEPFVLALLRSGAGETRNRRQTQGRVSPKTLAEVAQQIQGRGDVNHLFFELGPLSAPAGAACGAQDVTEAVTEPPEREVDAATRPPQYRTPLTEQSLSFWLRDLSYAMRESSESVRQELRGLGERVEQLGERVETLEKQQARVVEILQELKR